MLMSACGVQGVEQMSRYLTDTLTNPRTTPGEAQEPIRFLLQLQADGATAVQPLNPAKLYLDSQVSPCGAHDRQSDVLNVTGRLNLFVYAVSWIRPIGKAVLWVCRKPTCSS